MTPDNQKKKGGERLIKKSGKGPKAPKPKRSRREVILRSVLLACTILAVIVIGMFAAYKMLVVEPTVDVTTQRPPKKPAQTLAPGQTAPPEEEVSTDRKSERFYTILVAGRDTGGGGNTDVVMLVAYDVTNQRLNVMNIPRDTIVNKSWDIKKINSVYNYEGGQANGGVESLKNTVADTVGVYADFYVMVEWEAVGRLATAVGGVEFDVPLNMNYDDPYQALHIHIGRGVQTLNGEQVMKVLRFRKNNDGSGYPNGDLGRIATQQKLLSAIAKKLLTPATLTRLPELVNIFAENVETDLAVSNLLWFGESALQGGLNMENVNFVTMPAANYNGFFYSRSTDHNESYVFPDVKGIIELVNADFNPYEADITEEDLDIVYKKADGTIAATGGALKDPQANPAYWAYLARPPKESKDPDASASPDVSDDPDVSRRPDASRDPEDPDATDDPGFEDPDIGIPIYRPSRDPAHSRDPEETEEPGKDEPGRESPPPAGEPGETETPEPERPDPEPDPGPEETLWEPQDTPEPPPQEGPPEGIAF